MITMTDTFFFIMISKKIFSAGKVCLQRGGLQTLTGTKSGHDADKMLTTT
jgi:hypothetical protein